MELKSELLELKSLVNKYGVTLQEIRSHINNKLAQLEQKEKKDGKSKQKRDY